MSNTQSHSITISISTHSRGREIFSPECSCGWAPRTRCSSDHHALLIADAHTDKAGK